LVRLWREGELFGVQQVLFCVWFLIALWAQLFVQNTGVWIAGLLAQVVLACVLIIKERIDNIY
jgi:ABC-type thiamin/hydroxymethylpyrimidine transport system permease subunit